MPIEIPFGEDEWQIKDLSWEMIIAAMLKIFAWDPSHKDIEYYRNFIHAVRPDINEEMTQTGIIKAGDKDYEISEELFLSLAHFNPNIEQNFTNLALVYEDQAELYGLIAKLRDLGVKLVSINLNLKKPDQND